MEKAQDYRQDNPGLGCAKLYLIIKELFEETGCMPGRDAFIEILRKHGLMVHIRRRKHYKTTDSNHNYRKYPNLIVDLIPTRPNEVWVADITYVETTEVYVIFRCKPNQSSCKNKQLNLPKSVNIYP